MPEPLFLQGARGQLFCIYYPPLNKSPKAILIHVAAFAEEMNKSRRMIALQSHALVDMDVAVLVLDLFGTGDSEGLLEDACLDGWMDDITAAVEWVNSTHQAPVFLWGLRFGCALAVEFTSQNAALVQGLVFWQPLLSAKMMLNQFLRLRIASAMTSQMNDGQQNETTKSLLADLENDQLVEVGGYMLSPELVRSLLTLDPATSDFEPGKSIIWLDFGSSGTTEPGAANQKLISKWQKHHQILWDSVTGDRFWNTQEISLCPPLIKQTTDLLSQVL